MGERIADLANLTFRPISGYRRRLPVERQSAQSLGIATTLDGLLQRDRSPEQVVNKNDFKAVIFRAYILMHSTLFNVSYLDGLPR